MVSSYTDIAANVAHTVTEVRLLYFSAQHGYLWSTGFASRNKLLYSIVFACLILAIVNFHFILIFLCLVFGAVQ